MNKRLEREVQFGKAGGEEPAWRLLNRKQVAEILEVSERTVYGLTASGELNAISIGRSIRYPMDNVEAFINRKRGVQ